VENLAEHRSCKAKSKTPSNGAAIIIPIRFHCGWLAAAYAVENKVHVHDFQATVLHLLGIDHEKLTYKFQGRYFRLTDVHGNVVKPVLA
jgi:hypothetical protein